MVLAVVSCVSCFLLQPNDFVPVNLYFLKNASYSVGFVFEYPLSVFCSRLSVQCKVPVFFIFETFLIQSDMGYF